MTFATPKTFTPEDTSQRARSLARMIDRLEPGTYMLEIAKPAEGPWVYNLIQPVTIRKGNLPKEVSETP